MTAAVSAYCRCRLVVLGSALGLLCSTAAFAQRPGAPPLELPLQATGFGVGLHYARGDVMPAFGKTRSLGGVLELRRGAVTFGAGGAALDGSAAGSGWSADAAIAAEACAPLRAASITGGFHVCELLPHRLGLRVRGAIGHARMDQNGTVATITEAIVSAASMLRAPTPFASIELWTGPRVQIRAANALASGGNGTTRAGAGWSLGLGLTSTGGLGGSVAIDGMWIERPPNDGFRGSFGFGAGLHYLH